MKILKLLLIVILVCNLFLGYQLIKTRNEVIKHLVVISSGHSVGWLILNAEKRKIDFVKYAEYIKSLKF